MLVNWYTMLIICYSLTVNKCQPWIHLTIHALTDTDDQLKLEMLHLYKINHDRELTAFGLQTTASASSPLDHMVFPIPRTCSWLIGDDHPGLLPAKLYQMTQVGTASVVHSSPAGCCGRMQGLGLFDQKRARWSRGVEICAMLGVGTSILRCNNFLWQYIREFFCFQLQ